MSVLNFLALIVGAVSFALAALMLMLVLWQEARSQVNIFCAVFTGAAAIWYLGLLLARMSAYIQAPDELFQFGVRLFEFGFTASCITLYLFVVIITGGQGRFFLRTALVAMGATLAYQLLIAVVASGAQTTVLPDGTLNYGYGGLWAALYILFALATLFILYQRRRKLVDPLVGWGGAIFAVGVLVELISPQFRSRGIPMLLCAPAILIINYAMVKSQIMEPLSGRESQLKGFRDVSLAIASNLQLDGVLNTIAGQAAYMLEADGAAIFLKNGNRLELAAVHNMPVQFVGHQLPSGEGLSNEVVERGKLIRMEDYRRDWQGAPDMPYAREAFGSVIAAPLTFREDVVGVLFAVVNPQGKRFDRDDVRLLEMLGPQAAVAIMFEQQQELDRMKNQMIRMTSHDLKNPLFSAMSHMELLQEEGENVLTDEMKQDVQTTWVQLLRMERIIRGILDYERVQSGTPRFEEYDMRDLIQQSVTEIGTYARRQGIELRTNIPVDLPLIVGDRHYMIQAVTNLIENAIKFTHRGGCVTISAEKVDDTLILHVADTGVGIPDEAQARIFERFFRANHPGMEPVSGTGLGLSLVKAVMDAHNGRIWLDSTVGVGTTFHVALPLRAVNE
jgi:signal transduction histidine kinase